LRKAIIITQKEAIHLKARVTFTDIYKVKRKAGDEWLITRDISEWHIQDVNEKIIDRPQAITLTSR
jgi:major vault protein